MKTGRAGGSSSGPPGRNRPYATNSKPTRGLELGQEKLNFQTIPMHGNRRSIGFDEYRDDIVNKLIVVTGPYRGGTTLLVDYLNARQDCCVASDFLEREHTSLFYFAGQTGVGAYLAIPELSAYTTRGILKNGLFEGDHIVGLTKVLGRGFKNERFTFREEKRFIISDLDRYTFPIKDFHEKGYRLVLKHPELSFNFPELGKLLPQSKFVLTYRPMMYVVRSWIRATKNKPGTWADLFDVWFDREGGYSLPVNLPKRHKEAWQDYTTFQRIVCFNDSLYECYLDNVATWDRSRYFLYHHQNLCEHPDLHRKAICDFLELTNRDRPMFEFQKKFLRNRNKEISFTDEQNGQAFEVLGRSLEEATEYYNEEFDKHLSIRPQEKRKTESAPRVAPRTLATPAGFMVDNSAAGQ